jgi:hypothetical protein
VQHKRKKKVRLAAVSPESDDDQTARMRLGADPTLWILSVTAVIASSDRRYRELLDGAVMSVTGFEGLCGAEEGGVSAGRLLVVVAVDF